MSNIALIGERKIIIGFSLLGLQLFPADNQEEAVKALRDCAQGNIKIVFITNELAQKIINDIEEYQKHSTMAICILPGRIEETALSMRLLRKNIEKAVGTDILFRNEG